MRPSWARWCWLQRRPGWSCACFLATRPCSRFPSTAWSTRSNSWFYVILGVAGASCPWRSPGSSCGCGTGSCIFRPHRLVPAAAGGVMVGLMGWWLPQVLGVGYSYVGDVLNGRMALEMMVLLVVMKLFAVTTSYASGNAGGLFRAESVSWAPCWAVLWAGSPTCFLPLYTARARAPMRLWAWEPCLRDLRAPMTSVLMIFETTQDYAVIVPLMISNLVSFFISSPLQRPHLRCPGIPGWDPPAHLGHAVPARLVGSPAGPSTFREVCRPG